MDDQSASFGRRKVSGVHEPRLSKTAEVNIFDQYPAGGGLFVNQFNFLFVVYIVDKAGIWQSDFHIIGFAVNRITDVYVIRIPPGFDLPEVVLFNGGVMVEPIHPSLYGNSIPQGGYYKL